ncbi:MAG: TAXI family TRAP transporter solute-binding subunit [Armatimonadota bacterium]|nr:TAXI family TRAP transporter solute-binding subunit [Armatimonadota bacterium]MDR7450676.1 TAXI family TRAP transporter solute-binding subunit [Armatimonadota bacterium]MDR7466032.1 TAXI family TRAP transporter solute-binding subunit [Armatimonadota bacterium]MDR7493931.1 TAXI family TRAP transporter solute-binding subunit [Armatimonadota bacterium]MDR7504036.1 TAXI family TRAP transporter solute-binding subunit [Armatimonadota bacterium]
MNRARWQGVLTVAVIAVVTVSLWVPSALSAPSVRLSIVTGGTGGVYFPLGGGLAQLISRYIPNVQATAEVTSASVDNMRLIGAKRADIAFTLADTAFDAYKGEAAFRGNPIPIRTLTPIYNNFNHLVTLDGTGITTIADVRGKRVSVGSPGSGTEVTALRILEAAGINPDRDIRKERLGVAESADALKDRKIDAFFWSGGLPTAAVLDLATTPGIRIRLVPLDTTLPELQKKYGNLYFRSVILKEIYPGSPANAPTVGVANLLVVHQDFSADLAYQITKLIYERRAELAAVHKEAANITITGVAGRSPVPFHPGAIRYFRERGVQGF